MNSDVTRIQPAPLDSAHLVLYRGDARLEVIDLPLTGGNITIGRAQSNRVVIPDAKCSRCHCEIYSRNGRWYIRDLDSRNGVTLDGMKIQGDQVLTFGDVLGIGAYRLVFTNQPLDEATPAASDSAYQIVERKSGTQYDGLTGLERAMAHRDNAADLFRIARAMPSATSETDLAQVVLRGLCAHTGAPIGGLLLSPPGETANLLNLLDRAVVGDRPAQEFSTFLTRIALEDRDAILAHDIRQHASLSSQESLQELQAESAICAPIRHGNDVLGVIHLYSLSTESPPTQADLEFVLAVADQAGDQLHALRERALLAEGLDRVRRHVSDLQGQLAAETELVGSSSRLEDLRRALARVAPTDALVLIRGESGVGKELVARAVHFNSRRKDGPFVCVNCAALTPSLLESELFGHEKGAFTGASARRAGKFEQAHGGTLFLDEIGEMSPEIQAKFLRVLEGQAFERVGGGEPIEVDVRVVTATNRNLEEAVRDKRFRRDLFFRLQVIEIVVPPLKEHPEDIPAIAQHFVQRFAAQAHRKVRGFDSAAIRKLQEHHWSGNVRELRNVVERAVILADHEILGVDDVVLTKLTLEDDDSIAAAQIATDPGVGLETSVDPLVDLWGSFIQQNTTLDDIDRFYIEAVLHSTDWNKSKAARILQIERTTLDRRLKKYGLNRPGGEDDSDFE